jgi:hypothetical protein
VAALLLLLLLLLLLSLLLLCAEVRVRWQKGEGAALGRHFPTRTRGKAAARGQEMQYDHNNNEKQGA